MVSPVPRRVPARLLAVLALLAGLFLPRAAGARVGLAEWRIELPGGLVLCHGDEAPDACGAVCLYDPATQAIAVADVDEYKIYQGVVVGSTTRGDFFLVDEATRAVERFADHEALTLAVGRRSPAEIDALSGYAMIHGGYFLAPLALLHALFTWAGRRRRPARPVERRIELYLVTSFLALSLCALGFLVLPCLDEEWMGAATFAQPTILLYLGYLHFLPALIGTGLAMVLASLATLIGVPIAARLRVPPRFTWLSSYAVCHLLVLRFTVGEFILRFNPYWRGGF